MMGINTSEGVSTSKAFILLLSLEIVYWKQCIAIGGMYYYCNKAYTKAMYIAKQNVSDVSES